MQDKDTKIIDNYQLALHEMELADVPHLHELSIAVRWPHRPEDWTFLLEHGKGLIAKDEIGRLVGTAMWIPYGPKQGNICMVITSPRFQTLGAARWLMEKIVVQMDGRAKNLIATKEAYRLYISMGFKPTSTIYQHNGIVHQAPKAPDHARSMTVEDHAAIIALDFEATGLVRDAILKQILRTAEGTVVTQAGQVTGFALCRHFGRGHVVGPIVASSQEDAIALLDPIVKAYQDKFLRVDTAFEGPLRDYLTATGMVHFDTATRMALGGPVIPAGSVSSYAIVSQAFG